MECLRTNIVLLCKTVSAMSHYQNSKAISIYIPMKSCNSLHKYVRVCDITSFQMSFYLLKQFSSNQVTLNWQIYRSPKQFITVRNDNLIIANCHIKALALKMISKQSAKIGNLRHVAMVTCNTLLSQFYRKPIKNSLWRMFYIVLLFWYVRKL